MEDNKHIDSMKSKINKLVMEIVELQSDSISRIIESYFLQNKASVDELVCEKIKEVQVYIDELDINGLTNKLGYKMNTPKLKKAEVDFKIRRIMNSIIKSKKFKKDVNKRICTSPRMIFLTPTNISAEEQFLKDLENLIRDIIIEELFYQVKKSDFIILNNIVFVKKELSKLKLILLRMMKYIGCNWKNGVSFFIINLIISTIASVVANIITKLINRRVKSPVIILFKNQRNFNNDVRYIIGKNIYSKQIEITILDHTYQNML